ncbi:MAG: NAD(P)(+) transhydrogenase (Re/Si-specific) subunit alpha [Bacteroidia bacterium]
MRLGFIASTDGRFFLSPAQAKALAATHELYIEKGAGKAAYWDDAVYRDHAHLASRSEVIEKAELIISLEPLAETELREKKYYLNLFSFFAWEPHRLETYKKFQSVWLGMDRLPRSTRAQSMDALSSQSAIAGYRAVLLAAQALKKFIPMLTTAAGTYPPARVLVVGVGVAGLQALAIAKRLGAQTYAYDVRPAVKEEVQSVGAKFVEVAGVSAQEEGGYAKELPPEMLQKQQQALFDAVIKSDVVITTAQVPGKPAPRIITKEMVEYMQPGSVIVDLAAARGGNCELTQPDTPVITPNGVQIFGPTNLPAQQPMDASMMLSRNLYAYLQLILPTSNWAPPVEDEIYQATLLYDPNSETA